MSERQKIDERDNTLDVLWQILLDDLQNQRIIRSERIRKVFEKWPRYVFVDQSKKKQVLFAAGENSPLRIGHGQTISQPEMVVEMTTLLDPQKNERVLDIGLGSGWQAAILKECVGVRGQVIAIERVASLLNAAKKRFEKLGLNIEIILGDATNIADLPMGQFDIITCAAGADMEPDFWKKLLKKGGRMVVPRNVGEVVNGVFYRSEGEFSLPRVGQKGQHSNSSELLD